MRPLEWRGTAPPRHVAKALADARFAIGRGPTDADEAPAVLFSAARRVPATGHRPNRWIWLAPTTVGAGRARQAALQGAYATVALDRPDAIGVPRPRITYSIDDYSKRALEHGRRIFREIAAALKATDLHEAPDMVSSGHVMGTYRMGTDAKQSVVNRDQQSHDHPNLFLLGSGVFPTGAASNPTLTIAALALRAVSAIQLSASSSKG